HPNAAALAAGQKKKYLLILTATDKVWVSVTIDKRDKKERLLNLGEKVQFEADDSFYIILGNAGGVKMELNGKNIENSWKRGEVAKINLPISSSQLPAAANPIRTQ
ncbi:MAG: DUF4115 domain-containing protein, partial [Nitrospirae bacterium]|nr:DUF4115 domain-containing protein [Nitrospirota bacterium]